MATITEIADSYYQAVEAKNLDAINNCFVILTEYLSQVINQTREPYNNISDYSFQSDLVLHLLALQDIDKQEAPNLFDFVSTLKDLKNNQHLRSTLLIMLDHYDSKFSYEDLSYLKQNEKQGLRAILTSFFVVFRIAPNAQPGSIWFPDLSFLRTGERAEPAPQPLGKGPFIRSLKFNPNTTLAMLTNYWSIDKTVKYLSRDDKKQLKVRKTATPYVLKRDMDTEKLPQNHYLYSLSMHGGLYAVRAVFEISGRIHHSTFRAGQMVKSAGEMVVNELGIITKIDGNSGHYATPDFNLIEAALYLFKSDIINDECVIELRFTSISKLTEEGLEFKSNVTIKELLTDDSLEFSSSDVQQIVDKARESKGASILQSHYLKPRP